jgi:uncharacterized protein (DUF3820 family)
LNQIVSAYLKPACCALASGVVSSRSLKIFPTKWSPGIFGYDQMQPEDLNLLVSRQMPFGKHKGTIIADLPGNYLNWFAREGFPPGEIGRLLALMQEIDHNGLKDLLKPLRRSPGPG